MHQVNFKCMIEVSAQHLGDPDMSQAEDSTLKDRHPKLQKDRQNVHKVMAQKLDLCGCPSYVVWFVRRFWLVCCG